MAVSLFRHCTVQLLICGVLLGTTPALTSEPRPLSEFQAEATKQNVALDVPHFERTPQEIEAAAEAAIKTAEERLEALAKQDPSTATFESTVVALDRIQFDVRNIGNRISLLKDTLPEAATRETASSMSVKLSSWLISLDYRNDIYRVIKGFADTAPTLTGEDQLLLEEVLRDYRRAGLSLPEAKRKEVESLRKELTALTTVFNDNVVAATAELNLTPKQAEGLPDSFLSSPGVKQSDGSYKALIHVTWHYGTVAENAVDPEIRKQAHVLRYNLAKEKNVPLLNRIVRLRTDLAKRLGYETWADFQIEPRMAKNANAALGFLEELVKGLQPKFDQELEVLRLLKAKETGKADAQLDLWDVPYYTNKLKREKYSVDVDQLRAYFPYQAAVTGMFNIYSKLFGLEFVEVTPPEKWTQDLQLYVVKDRQDGEILGLFYFDMFPRDGKYNHFACFPIYEGLRTPSGKQSTPIAALVCNFPPPSADTPALLRHDEVEILYHEFGHVMHHVLGRSKHARHFSFNVEQDFVEAPSQMLENWVWDKNVLDTFAADYREPSKKVPTDIIRALKEARTATSASFYRRQLSFGVLDLVLHMQKDVDPALDVVALSNRELSRIHLPPAPDTAFVAYFGHLAGGYDAGYYGYMWSLAIAQDMASVFANSNNSFMNEEVGRRLRQEVYGAAASRTATESVQEFLKRPQSIKPFLRFVGAEDQKEAR